MGTLIRPSYHQGFARSAGESKHPNLWRRIKSMWIPGLGNTGVIRNIIKLSNDGVLTSGAWVGEGIKFVEASNDYVTIPVSISDEVDNTLTGTNFTLLFDIHLNVLINSSNVGETLFNKQSSCGCWWHGSDAGRLRFGTFGANTQSTRDVWPIGNYRIAITKEGTDYKIYINGFLDNSGTNADTITSLSTDILVGADTSNVWYSNFIFKGLYLWDSALKQNELLLFQTTPYAPFQLADNPIGFVAAVAAGRIMSSLTNHGGLAGFGGIAGRGGGLAG